MAVTGLRDRVRERQWVLVTSFEPLIKLFLDSDDFLNFPIL